jgi:3-oxoadipate enol-lactonase
MLGIGPCTIVGNSLGGRVALELAVGRPELVGALVLVGTLLPGAGPSPALHAFDEAERDALEAGDLDRAVEVNLDMWLADDVDPDVRERVRAMQLRAFELQMSWGDELSEDPLVADVQARLAEIEVPTLVVVGDRDVDDVQRYAHHLVASIRAAELAVIEGAAHLPSLERPQAFDAVVVPFLERASR